MHGDLLCTTYSIMLQRQRAVEPNRWCNGYSMQQGKGRNHG
jgi:hypothetical protein